ncbi:ankyrin repeat domain-containing protein 31 [Petaurus breviceps papuanus]|uniref:ankyrin repeat domain-containing protein 31 n=1 Tax=Petaurus breviceps papuanus TaxID=3040969 RepID=UPI0036DD9C27
MEEESAQELDWNSDETVVEGLVTESEREDEEPLLQRDEINYPLFTGEGPQDDQVLDSEWQNEHNYPAENSPEQRRGAFSLKATCGLLGSWELSDGDDSPEISLLSGAVITSYGTVEVKKKSSKKLEGSSVLSESLKEVALPSKEIRGEDSSCEMLVPTTEDSTGLSESLLAKYQFIVNKFETKELLKPLSDLGTPKSMSPVDHLLICQEDGLSEDMQENEKNNAIPAELLTALNTLSESMVEFNCQRTEGGSKPCAEDECLGTEPSISQTDDDCTQIAGMNFEFQHSIQPFGQGPKLTEPLFKDITMQQDKEDPISFGQETLAHQNVVYLDGFSKEGDLNSMETNTVMETSYILRRSARLKTVRAGATPKNVDEPYKIPEEILQKIDSTLPTEYFRTQDSAFQNNSDEKSVERSKKQVLSAYRYDEQIRKNRRTAKTRKSHRNISKLSSINRRDIYGESPLHKAAQADDSTLVKKYIKLGGNVNLADYAEQRNRSELLHPEDTYQHKKPECSPRSSEYFNNDNSREIKDRKIEVSKRNKGNLLRNKGAVNENHQKISKNKKLIPTRNKQTTVDQINDKESPKISMQDVHEPKSFVPVGERKSRTIPQTTEMSGRKSNTKIPVATSSKRITRSIAHQQQDPESFCDLSEKSSTPTHSVTPMLKNRLCHNSEVFSVSEGRSAYENGTVSQEEPDQSTGLADNQKEPNILESEAAEPAEAILLSGLPSCEEAKLPLNAEGNDHTGHHKNPVPCEASPYDNSSHKGESVTAWEKCFLSFVDRKVDSDNDSNDDGDGGCLSEGTILPKKMTCFANDENQSNCKTNSEHEKESSSQHYSPSDIQSLLQESVFWAGSLATTSQQDITNLSDSDCTVISERYIVNDGQNITRITSDVNPEQIPLTSTGTRSTPDLSGQISRVEISTSLRNNSNVPSSFINETDEERVTNERGEKSSEKTYTEKTQESHQKSIECTGQSHEKEATKMEIKQSELPESDVIPNKNIQSTKNMNEDLRDASQIKQGIEKTIPSQSGWTALHEAANKGFSEVMVELLKAGANVNSESLDGLLPIHNAVSGNHLKHESIGTILQDVEEKQESLLLFEIRTCKDADQYSEKMSQIKDIIDSVLAKQKKERDDIAKKYRASAESFRHGALREQLADLATRQKNLLMVAQKQKKLSHKIQNYKNTRNRSGLDVRGESPDSRNFSENDKGIYPTPVEKTRQPDLVSVPVGSPANPPSGSSEKTHCATESRQEDNQNLDNCISERGAHEKAAEGECFSSNELISKGRSGDPTLERTSKSSSIHGTERVKFPLQPVTSRAPAEYLQEGNYTAVITAKGSRSLNPSAITETLNVLETTSATVRNNTYQPGNVCQPTLTSCLLSGNTAKKTVSQDPPRAVSESLVQFFHTHQRNAQVDSGALLKMKPNHTESRPIGALVDNSQINFSESANQNNKQEPLNYRAEMKMKKTRIKELISLGRIKPGNDVLEFKMQVLSVV